LSIMSCMVYLFLNQHYIPEEPMIGARNTEAHQAERMLLEEFNHDMNVSAGLVIEGKANEELIEEMKELMTGFTEISKVVEVRSNKAHNSRLFYLEYKEGIGLGESQMIISDLREKLNIWERKSGL